MRARRRNMKMKEGRQGKKKTEIFGQYIEMETEGGRH